MFSTVIRRVVPSLRHARPYTATAHTQAAESLPSKLREGEQAIYDKLSERFLPSELLVQDVSGAPPLSSHTPQNCISIFVLGGCGTFYAIAITSAAFKGIPVVEQHRLVNKILKKEIEGIHGLQVRVDPSFILNMYLMVCTA
jgi:BolA-like protein 3